MYLKINSIYLNIYKNQYYLFEYLFIIKCIGHIMVAILSSLN